MMKKMILGVAVVCAAAVFAAEPTGDPVMLNNRAYLMIAKLPEGLPPIVADGKLDEKAWDFASSMPQLIRGNAKMSLSGELPPHAFRLAYDDENLYLAFTTVFPGRVSYVEGLPRTEGTEPEVWGTESWEFNFALNGHTYRFGANVAGGTTEWRDGDAKWNGKWKYASSRAMRIDDTVLWTGEAVIPWSTLDHEVPPTPSETIEFNPCRTWTLSTFSGISSLEATGRTYGRNATTPTGKFGPTAAYQLKKRTDPADGEYAAEFQLAASHDAKVTYEVLLVKLDDSEKKTVFSKTYDMKAGQTLDDSLKISTLEPGFQAIMHILRENGNVVMRETVQYELSKEVVRVTTFYLKDFIRLKFKKPFNGRIILTGPGGKTLLDEPSAGKDCEVKFAKTNPAGKYVLKLVDASGATTVDEELEYPGLGDWAKQDFHEDWILPPFTPMTEKTGENSLQAAMYARVYSWEKSYLPSSITARGAELLAEPVEILIDGVAIRPSVFTTGLAKPHRAEFTAEGDGVALAGWIEYDGTQFNRVTLLPKGCGEVKIRFAMPACIAKFLHASPNSTAWGAKRTEKVMPGRKFLGAFPTVWLGDEEKGLTFFFETRANWTTDSKKTYTLERSSADSNKVYLTVNVADTLKAGEPFTFEFGLLATPIRPLASNYPFNTLGDSYFSKFNRPGRRPTCYVSELTADCSKKGSDLGSSFGDLDTKAGRIRDENIRMILKKYEEGTGSMPIAYTCSRHLSVYYPEVAAFLPSWTFKPEIGMDYSNTGHFVYDLCPTTMGNDMFIYIYKHQLKRYPQLRGIYLDFGTVRQCSNEDHGCREKTPLLGMREFYRRLNVAQIEAGVKEPIVVIHNTDYLQPPAMAFVSHLLNGEHIRQASSPLLHDKKDILDSYDIEMWASELSTMPWGIANSCYFPTDTLSAKNGGDETNDAYKFRMWRAQIGPCLVHNTIPAMWRGHLGFFDKLIRHLDGFGVDKAEFTGYWKNPAKVLKGKGVYVSTWKKDGKILACVAHIAREHLGQDIEIDFSAVLDAPIASATDKFTSPDPDYNWMIERRKQLDIYWTRVPLEWGDVGTRVNGFDGKVLKYHLPFHSFGLVELIPE